MEHLRVTDEEQEGRTLRGATQEGKEKNQREIQESMPY